MDSRAVIARFEAERQALALMEHPNIARVLDAGTTEAGRLYFVMELVEGPPITDYCDHRGLSVPERLQLFIQICDAIHHAHQKGVIHRDIKPSNILIAEPDTPPTCHAEGDRLRHRVGNPGPAHRQDPAHGLRALHRHAGVHEPRAGGCK